MHDIKALRGRLGLSQEYFAVLIGVRRSLLSMAELGKRELPTEAMKKLDAFRTALGKPGQTKPDSPKTALPANMEKIFKELHGWATEQSVSFAAMAGQMEKNYAMALLRQKTLPLLYPEPDKKERVVLDLLEMETEDWVANCNPKWQKWCKQMSLVLQKMPVPAEKSVEIR